MLSLDKVCQSSNFELQTVSYLVRSFELESFPLKVLSFIFVLALLFAERSNILELLCC